ncbi:hypothetical protein T492DRAFT_983043 [Pavlovales sp. CCMP2436]|nr:hypothetical protein T492DRAFT_983043 [Pavlovales sp. CCMP2436]
MLASVGAGLRLAGAGLLGGLLLAAGLRVLRARRRRLAAQAPARLAIIVVTSPAPCHPSTRLIECLLNSLRFVPDLADAPITLVCDGTKRGESDKYKKGICTPDLDLRYREFIRRLRALVASQSKPWCARTSIIELPSRHGFGFAVRQAMISRVSDFVIVLQHDRPFVRGCDIDGVVTAMAAHPAVVKYVCLPTQSTHAHPQLVYGRHQVLLPEARAFGPVSLAPLAFWYDSTHIVQREHYLAFVFGFGPEEARVRRGQFPEDTLGTSMMADITTNGIEVRHLMYDQGYARHALNDGQPTGEAAPEGCTFVPVVVHADGRSKRWTDGFEKRGLHSGTGRYPHARP